MTILWALLSFAWSLWLALTHAHTATCPPGWFVNGITEGGSFTCLPTGKEGAPEPDGVLSARLFCADLCPVVVDFQTVACRNAEPCRGIGTR